MASAPVWFRQGLRRFRGRQARQLPHSLLLRARSRIWTDRRPQAGRLLWLGRLRRLLPLGQRMRRPQVERRLKPRLKRRPDQWPEWGPEWRPCGWPE